jgi:putative transposase
MAIRGGLPWVQRSVCERILGAASCGRWPGERKTPVKPGGGTVRGNWLELAVNSSVHNHFNQERHLYSRDNFKRNRAAALSEWRQLGVA